MASLLNSSSVVEVGMPSGVAAVAAEKKRKHSENDVKCKELGWRCIPLVVEAYGAWELKPFRFFLLWHQTWL